MGKRSADLNVAMVSTWHCKCGVATYSENLVNALAKQGVTIYVVRVPRFGQKTQESLLNVVQQIPVNKIDCVHIQHEYGIFQGFEQPFYSALKAIRKPLITTMHAVGVRLDTDSGIATMSDRVVVHNKFCTNRFGYPKKTVVIPHGASLHETDPPEKAKISLGLQPEAPIVGYCGYISEYKGLEVLVEAMTKVRNVGLLIAGGWHTDTLTPYMASLKQRSFELLPNRCQWLGYIPDGRLPVVYGAMDVLCYCSRFSTESGALLMGLSYGRPTIASSIPPFKEKEKQGALITFRGIKDLTRKIKQLLKDEDLRLKLAEGARRYVESVKWYPTIAERHISLYQDVIKRYEEKTKPPITVPNRRSKE